jgi:hypothetical protein
MSDDNSIVSGLEHFNFLCAALCRRQDKSGKEENAAIAILWRVFLTPPDEAATGIKAHTKN